MSQILKEKMVGKLEIDAKVVLLDIGEYFATDIRDSRPKGLISRIRPPFPEWPSRGSREADLRLVCRGNGLPDLFREGRTGKSASLISVCSTRSKFMLRLFYFGVFLSSHPQAWDKLDITPLLSALQAILMVDGSCLSSTKPRDTISVVIVTSQLAFVPTSVCRVHGRVHHGRVKTTQTIRERLSTRLLYLCTSLDLSRARVTEMVQRQSERLGSTTASHI